MTDFGRDTSCTTSLRTGRFVSGARVVAEAAFRRLITPRGMLRGGEEEQNYGLDLSDLVGSVATKAEAAALPGRIEAELRKDRRIEAVKATVTSRQSGPAVEYLVTVEGETAVGPFELVVRATELDVALLRLDAGDATR